MITEQEVQEAFDAAKALADAGHDASEEWERYYALCEQLPTPLCMDPEGMHDPAAMI
jgi:hypothetical protein